MALKHLRVCKPCGDRVRFAACGIACRLPLDSDRNSWLDNIQDGAGTLTFPQHVPLTAATQ